MENVKKRARITDPKDLKEQQAEQEARRLERLKIRTENWTHGKPVTRRDFLSLGLIQFAATITLPSIVNVLANSRVAEAADCGPSTNLSTLVTLSLSGGAAMMGNYIPVDQGGQLLPSYDLLGLGSRANLTNSMVYEFANRAPFYIGSQFLAGIQTTATPATLRKTVFVAIPCESQDDSGANKFDFTGLATKAGVAGGILPNLGTQNTVTGTKHQPAFVPPPTPLAVNNVNDFAAALGVTGSLSQLSDSQKSSLFRMINRLSASQARTISSLAGGKILGELIQSATNDNHSLISKGGALTNPAQDQQVGDVLDTLWGGIQNPGAQASVFASMVYNSLKGNAGTCNLEMGGYDYHNNGRANTDADDLAAGQTMGRILETAAIMNKPLFLVVQSDGAVGAQRSDDPGAPFVSDRGSGGCMYIMAYHPTKAPETTGFQIGHVTTGQGADDTFISGTPDMAAIAAFANYLAFNGQLGRFESLSPTRVEATDLDKITKIKG